MSKVIVKPKSDFTKPNRTTLVSEYSPKFHRGTLNWTCIFHEGGKTTILTRGGELKTMTDMDYFTAISGKQSQGGAALFINPVSPRVIKFDRANMFYEFDNDSVEAQYLRLDPSVSVDGMPAKGNMFLSMTSSEVENKKATSTFELKLLITNFVNDTSKEDGALDKLKNMVFYFGSGIKAKETIEELVIQLVGERGLLWDESSEGKSNALEFKNVFVDNSTLDKDLKIACNKAVQVKVIEVKNKEKGVVAYYWGDSFISHDIDGVYEYFRNDKRQFDSLCGEVNRKTSKPAISNEELVTEKASTSPNRSTWIAAIVKAVEEGKLTLEAGEVPSKLKNARLEALYNLIPKGLEA